MHGLKTINKMKNVQASSKDPMVAIHLYIMDFKSHVLELLSKHISETFMVGIKGNYAYAREIT